MDLSTKSGRREQGQRVQRAIERAGLSIEELAGRIGCSRALIYQYLSGSTLAQPDRLQQIARECGVSFAAFYAEDDTARDMPPAQQAAALAAPPPPQEVAARLGETLRALQELADAQESPPDYRSLATTCERILSLASQLGDRAIQGQAWKRLGNARLRSADFARAVEALNRAVALAQEAGDTTNETGARQSLGTAMVSMGRISEAQAEFTRIASGSLFSGRWQGTLSLGGIHEMQGEYRAALQRLDDAASILEEGERTGAASAQEASAGMLYVTTNRRNVFMDEGDFRQARPLAEKGLADAEALGNADQHLEARFDLAWCDFHLGQWQDAYRGFTTMLQLARFVGDQGRETMARAWLGIFLAAAGEFDGAITYGKDALSLALSHGDRRGELYAQLALSDAYLGANGRESEARYHAAQALAITTALRMERAEAECRLRQVRLSRQAGDWDEALISARRALTLAQKLGARHLESLARLALSDTLLGQATNADNADALRTEARTHIETAQNLAVEIGLSEGLWRANVLLSTLEPSQAENVLSAAIALLEQLRQGLQEAGLPDTLLEQSEIFAVYRRRVENLIQSGRNADARAFVEQANWLPLETFIEAAPAEP